jgi:hypothetical protein
MYRFTTVPERRLGRQIDTAGVRKLLVTGQRCDPERKLVEPSRARRCETFSVENPTRGPKNKGGLKPSGMAVSR